MFLDHLVVQASMYGWHVRGENHFLLILEYLHSRAKRMHVTIFDHRSTLCRDFSTVYILISHVKFISSI